MIMIIITIIVILIIIIIKITIIIIIVTKIIITIIIIMVIIIIMIAIILILTYPMCKNTATYEKTPQWNKSCSDENSTNNCGNAIMYNYIMTQPISQGLAFGPFVSTALSLQPTDTLAMYCRDYIAQRSKENAKH